MAIAKKGPSLRELCRNSLGEIFLALHPAYGYVPFQQERIVPALEAVDASVLDRLMIFIPAGHAKTDLATKTFIPWYLARHPGENVILLCHTDSLAKDFGSAVRDTMTSSDVFRAVFPEVRVLNTNLASNFFKMSTGAAFYAFGMDGAITGRRADLIVIDDPVRSMMDALSDTVQHSLYETYKAVIKDRLRPGGKIVIPMTRWATRDVAARILADEGSRWKVLVLKAQEQPDGPYLWEEFYGRQHYEDAKMDPFIWAAKWQQDPNPQMAMPFQQRWLRFYVPNGSRAEYDADGNIVSLPVDIDKLFRLNTYILVDPALGKGKRNDPTCILVLAAGPERRLFLVDAVLDRLDPGERISQLVRLVRLWAPRQLVYEEYGLTADSYFIEERFKSEGIDLPITSVGRKGIRGVNGGRLTKHDRIMQLQADFREARIWLPKRMERDCLDGSRIDIVKYAIEREILPYAGDGSVEHDEFLDTLSRIHDPEVFIEHAGPRDDEEGMYYDHAAPQGSWESRY